MNYKEKLLDPRWQKKRLEILSRDNFQCTACGSKEKTLHVHHRYYGRGDPWDIADEALITLCNKCHSMEEVHLIEAINKLIGAAKLICVPGYIITSLASALLYFENNPEEAGKFLVDMQKEAYERTKRISVKELVERMITV